MVVYDIWDDHTGKRLTVRTSRALSLITLRHRGLTEDEANALLDRAADPNTPAVYYLGFMVEATEPTKRTV